MRVDQEDMNCQSLDKNASQNCIHPELKGKVSDSVSKVKEVPPRLSVESLLEQSPTWFTKVDAVNKDKDKSGLDVLDALDPSIFQKISDVYEFLLESCGDLSREVLQYLHERGISSETAEKMRLAYISDYGDLCESLTERFPQYLLEWSGLVNHKANLRFYKHRLVFPFVMECRVVYLQARSLDERVKPQEINLDRPVPCPFNTDVIKQDDVKRVYLCEGVIDALSLTDRGLPAVGIPDYRYFRRKWLRFFFGKDVFILSRWDKPGFSPVDYVHRLFLRARFPSKIVVVPSGVDLSSYSEVLQHMKMD